MASPSFVRITPTSVISTTPTSVGNATPSPSPAPVTEAEANGVVQNFFTALDRDDYQAAINTGSGTGQQQIQTLVDTIQNSARDRGVQPDISITNLTTDATTTQGSGRLVSASFTAAVYALAGPIRVPVNSSNGSAVFFVERVTGQPKITKISSIQGMPGT